MAKVLVKLKDPLTTQVFLHPGLREQHCEGVPVVADNNAVFEVMAVRRFQRNRPSYLVTALVGGWPHYGWVDAALVEPATQDSGVETAPLTA
jgi:hypothetical protein